MTDNGTPASSVAASARMLGGVAPAASARSEASWMIGPSMTGSEKGMPISIASAPASVAARTMSSQPGSPPVRYTTRLFTPSSRR